MQGLLFCEAGPFGDPAWPFPQAAEGVDNDARAGMREAQSIGEGLLDVPEIVDQIGNDDKVERFAFQVHEMSIAFDEPQFGILRMRAMNHGWAEIHADAD